MADDTNLILQMTSDIVTENSQFAVEASKLNKKGKPVPREYCPKEIWVKKDYKYLNDSSLPPLFYTSSHWFVSGSVAEILRGHDMGDGALYPVVALKSDRVSRFGGEYYCWIFGNSKSAFLEEQSPDVPEMDGVGRSLCVMPWTMKDDDVAVSADALGSPDVWVDPKLFKSVFFSGGLPEALISVGLKNKFRLCRCRLI
jgi:hypothetical protein